MWPQSTFLAETIIFAGNDEEAASMVVPREAEMTGFSTQPNAPTAC